MKARMISLSLMGVLLFSTSSCSLLPSTPSAVHDFGYPYTNAPSETTSSPQQLPITVEAPKWLSDNRIRYRLLYSTPTQVRFYSLDRWIAAPSELFEQLLKNNGKQQTSPVTIQLQVFEQQFDAIDKAKVVMRFTVTSTSDDKHHQPRTRDFNLQLPCPTPDAKGAVNGFTVLTKQAVDKIQAWVESSDVVPPR
jgi:cholesterol transport system auxiliary component